MPLTPSSVVCCGGSIGCDYVTTRPRARSLAFHLNTNLGEVGCKRLLCLWCALPRLDAGLNISSIVLQLSCHSGGVY